MISARRLQKRFGTVEVLRDVSLEVKAGEVVVIIGPSGSGKSMILGLIAGLIAPSAGVVRCGGEPLDDATADAWRARLAWLGQRPNFVKGSVLANLALGRPRPAGYLVSDEGVLNIALGSTDRADFEAVYRRATERGFEGHTKPWTLPGVATVVYLQDPQGLSVELLHVEPEALERMGFMAPAAAHSASRRGRGCE